MRKRGVALVSKCARQMIPIDRSTRGVLLDPVLDTSVPGAHDLLWRATTAGKEGVRMTVLSHGSQMQRGPVLTIRQAKGFDAPAIAELRALWGTGAQPASLFTSSIRAWLETEGEPRITLLANADGQPIGMVSMLEYRAMPLPGARSSRWGYIDHLFVRDGRRRQGIGTALIKELLAIADRRDYQKLLVAPNADALSVFDRLGFLMLDALGPEGILLCRPRLDAVA